MHSLSERRAQSGDCGDSIDLPDALYREVMQFAWSGRPATPAEVRDWLESQAVTGAISKRVSKILQHQKDAQKALAESAAVQRVRERKTALSQKPASPAKEGGAISEAESTQARRAALGACPCGPAGRAWRVGRGVL